MVRGFLGVFFFGLAFLLFSSTILAHIGNHLIVFKDGEAQPAELTIDLGEEVIFQNESTEEIWPASDPHPTHTIYPEFDPKRSIKVGDSWKFKFERSGQFKFHDHLNPHVGGVIKVVNTPESSKTTTEDASPKKTTQFKIPASFLRAYYYFFPSKLYPKLQSLDFHQVSQNEKDLEYWLTILGGEQFMDKLVADTQGGSKVDCHQEAHLVGRTAYELFGRSVFKKINYSCHSGYIHGAMEAFIKRGGTSNLMKRTEKLCQGYLSDFAKFECLHGIGHGLEAYVNYDLPKALNLCQGLSDDYARRSCFGGVFMENIMVVQGKGAVKGHQTKWANNDPHFPCNSVEQSELVQFECYQMQTSQMLQIFNYDFRPIVQECLRSPANMVSVCFRSMGRDVAGQVLRDPDKIIPLCQLSPPQHFQDCLTGGLNVIVDFWGETMTDQPQSFCNKLSDPKDKSYCFQVLSMRLKNIFGNNKSKIEEICKKAEEMFYQTCISSLYKS